ncbi:MAG: PorP/SprF family type IX secretion system membrane protein [Bacteroidales bacterium]|nr:PorP/SprF family type IX secretion system membrane protein [Bacteroidales bacterium]
MKIYTLFMVGLLFAGYARAQEYPILFHSQYQLNPYLINPAFSGSSNNFIINGSTRQIVGQPGAPVTHVFSFHSKFTPISRMAYGGIAVYDKDGPFRQFGAHFTGSYHLPLDLVERHNLSFAISATVNQHSLVFNSISSRGDDVLYDTENQVVPDVNIGVLYYSKEAFFGLSVAKALESKLSYENIQEVDFNRVYMAYGGYKIPASFMKIEPSVLFKTDKNFGKQVTDKFDYNIKVYIENMIVGTSYRYNESILALFAYQADFVRIGVAYTFPKQDFLLTGYSEINLQFEF